MKKLENRKVQIFADGADKAGMVKMYAKPYIVGLTIITALTKKVSITDCRAFCKDILRSIKDKPVSLDGLVASHSFFLDTQRFQALGWRPKVGIQAGVLNTVRYLRENEWVFEARA